MTARLARIRSTGAVVLLTTCRICGKPAAFGVGVNLLRKTRDKEGRERLAPDLGEWYCRQHRP